MDEREEKARLKRRQDYADLQDENAGRSVGKMRRFTSPSDSPEFREQQRRADDWYLLETLTYEQRIRRLRDRLDELDRASLEALREAERRVERTERALRELQDRAAVDPQGRRMYRTADGRTAFYEDETEVTREIQDATDWTGRPTIEQFRERRRHSSDAVQERDEIVEFRRELYEHRARIDSGDELSPDELAALDNWSDVTPSFLRADTPQRRIGTSAARGHVPDGTDSSAPNVAEAFVSAASTDASPVTSLRPPDRDRAPPPPPGAAP